VRGAGLGEDRADGRGDHGALGLGHLRENVVHEVHPVPLPGDPEHNLGGRCLAPQVVVARDQSHARAGHGHVASAGTRSKRALSRSHRSPGPESRGPRES